MYCICVIASEEILDIDSDSRTVMLFVVGRSVVTRRGLSEPSNHPSTSDFAR